MLSPYRVLDLSDERGLLCGQLLADLGADVIAVEPPSGSSARRLGPFFGDEPNPERSIYWWAYARNKRSITLDFTRARDHDLLLRLVEHADFLIDSADPRELTRLRIAYDDLSRVNPRLIHVSITPFGQTGPKSGDACSDLTALAASGVLALTGDEDRPPIRLRVPQAFLHAAADGALGALVALHARAHTGLGQHVDVSAQRSAALATQSAILAAPNGSAGLKRMAGGFNLGSIRIPAVWRAADGYVTLTVLFGQGFAAFTERLMAYLLDEVPSERGC
jgi:benzylsuccinate CoA-transferase BbsE subunit